MKEEYINAPICLIIDILIIAHNYLKRDNNNNNNNNLYFVLETWDITVHLITYIVIQLHKNNNC